MRYLITEVHIYATSSPCVLNSVLRRTAGENAEKFNPYVTGIIEKNFYADDALPFSFADVRM